MPYIVTRAGSALGSHSGNGPLIALTGEHATESAAHTAASNGVPNYNASDVERSRLVSIVRQWVDYPLLATNGTVRCNLCEIQS
jgi:hypothetical protein